MLISPPLLRLLLDDDDDDDDGDDDDNALLVEIRAVLAVVWEIGEKVRPAPPYRSLRMRKASPIYVYDVFIYLYLPYRYGYGHSINNEYNRSLRIMNEMI